MTRAEVRYKDWCRGTVVYTPNQDCFGTVSAFFMCGITLKLSLTSVSHLSQCGPVVMLRGCFPLQPLLLHSQWIIFKIHGSQCESPQVSHFGLDDLPSRFCSASSQIDIRCMTTSTLVCDLSTHLGRYFSANAREEFVLELEIEV